VQAENVQVVGAALAAGMYPKLLSMDQGGFKTIINQQPVAIVSVLRARLLVTIRRSADRSSIRARSTSE
jgi:hypothetical protein